LAVFVAEEHVATIVTPLHNVVRTAQQLKRRWRGISLEEPVAHLSSQNFGIMVTVPDLLISLISPLTLTRWSIG
jgi:hypothetical protein